MPVKKLVTGLILFVALFTVVTTIGLHSGFAETGVVTKPTENVNMIEVELNDDYFNPKVISIPNGITTTLKLRNKGKKEHTFTVEKLGIDIELQPGKEKNISVKPEQKGTYELICRYHFQEGMVGKVNVN